MKIREAALASLSSVSNGTAANIGDLESVYVHVDQNGAVATWQVQVSFDKGVTWQMFQSGTASALVGPLPPCGRVRGALTAFTSGTVKFGYGGKDPDRN